MVIIENIYIEGFGPFLNPTRFNFNQVGLNIIKARNGYGKTKLFSALFWGFYGETLGDHRVEPWDSIKTDSFKGTKVKIKYKIDGKPLELIRCREYQGKVDGIKGGNRLIYSNSKERDKRKVQADVINDLGFSADLFKNSVLFGQKLKRFIQEQGNKKKEILEEAFDVIFINKVRELVSKKNQGISTELIDYKVKLQNTLEAMALLEESLSDLNDAKESFIKIKKDRIKEKAEKAQENNRKAKELLVISNTNYKDKLLKLTIELKTLKSKIVKMVEVKARLSVNNDKGGIKDEIEELETKLKDLYNNICPTCGSKLSKDKHSHIEKKTIISKINVLSNKLAKIAINNREINRLHLELKDLRVKESTIEEKVNMLREKLVEQKGINDKLAELSEENKKLFEAINQIELESFDESKVNNIKRKIRIKSKLARKYKKDLDSLERVNNLNKWLLDDPLNNKGIKSFIFKEFMGYINKELKGFTKFLGFIIMMDVDMDSSNKNIDVTINKDGYNIPYSDLSGGQQQLVDVAIALSMHKVITKNKSINVLILDEIFESLDKYNIEIISNIIQDIAKDKVIFLITHRKDFVTVNANIINIKNVQGVASIA